MSNTNTTDLFLRAAKAKLRFQTSGGMLFTEDLFDLSLARLDILAGDLNASRATSSGSFLANPDVRQTNAQKEVELMFEVVIAVIADKEAENAKRLAKSTRDKQLAFFRELRDKKAIAGLESLSQEELEAKIAELSADTEG